MKSFFLLASFSSHSEKKYGDHNLMPNTSIIVPVYNERSSIAQVLEKLLSLPFEKQIIVIDDGSNDGTAAELEKFRSRGIDLILLPHNHGKGYAIRQAIPHAKGMATVIQDADFEYDPAVIPTLTQPIFENRTDVVYGARFLPVRRWTYHAITNLMITFWFNIVSGMRLNDMETGAKAFRTSVLQKIQLKSDRFGFEPEITARLNRMKIKILEIEYHHFISRTHAEGKKLKFKDGLAAVWHILRYNYFD